MYTPSSTYRIQFNKDFTFKDLKEHLMYLSGLGIGAIYASPVFAAVPGSIHGYDVTSPHSVNPEIGTLDELLKISAFLKAQNIGWIQDIVPNHMAFYPANTWLMDVLEKGRHSDYARFFDIDFDHPQLGDKILVPFLGKPLNEAILEKEIKLIWKDGDLAFTYYDFIFPVNDGTFQYLIHEFDAQGRPEFIGQEMATRNHKGDPVFQGINFKNIRERYRTLYQEENSFNLWMDGMIVEINNNPQKLSELLSKQNYHLAYWEDVNEQLNYRRFFTINGLISLRMEDPVVFDEYHRFILELVKKGLFQGLRIDHIDGLRNPNMYFDRMRVNVEDQTYLVVEKILEQNEQLERNWPLQGSSGYDFLALVNNLFTHNGNYPDLERFYQLITMDTKTPEDVIYEKKKQILWESFPADLDNLAHLLIRSGLVDFSGDITPGTMKEAVSEFLIACPVYKLYSDRMPLTREDKEIVLSMVNLAIAKAPHLAKPLKVLQNVFLGYHSTTEKSDAALDFFLRCMQYTGPLMAKGIEDTAMYTYNCLIAHNEVGASIHTAGLSVKEFHDVMTVRRRNLPMSMNATATHDTKRGEDARARLNVISEIPDEWRKAVIHWMQINSPLKTCIDGKMAPSANEEYFIYQTLVGAAPADMNTDKQFTGRVLNYLQKAMREARVNSNWNHPERAYETAVLNFARQILDPDSHFMVSFIPFIQSVIPFGIINSLSQVVLKCTCPGIPDFYQGTEFCDFSMVDPDNRRPVDYSERLVLYEKWKTLKHEELSEMWEKMAKDKENGHIKMWMTHRLMIERKCNPEWFVYAEYEPVTVKGYYKDHVLAFARVHKQTWYLTVIPLHLAAIHGLNELPEQMEWRNTRVILPDWAPRYWTNLWDNSGERMVGEVSIGQLIKDNVPVVWKGYGSATGRESGILLHVSSLPGKYAIGDLGEEAYRFVDFLAASGQSYWQVLPFNPVTFTYSPYSSTSALAGNTLFISPDMLLRSKLISGIPWKVAQESTVNFRKAEEIRSKLLDEAYVKFLEDDMPLIHKKFNAFCEAEKHWLDDFIIFITLKKVHGDKPWNEWPDKYRNREKASLNKFAEEHADELDKQKFAQFLFSHQWKQLKEYANTKGVKMIGDMSFYVSYDSADVWANHKFFNLDKHKRMITVAGVPPDYFSETGQLWNMPVYNWTALKKEKFSWWKHRIRRNLELCDLVRFDHFRGFSAYWEVPAGEKTAENGKWIKGPGSEFFNEMKKEFPHMPFIAEDLGEITPDVYKLRDDFSLPGMKVLQFAFGDDMPGSVHIPHLYQYNSIVYTGTHDNNTTHGWFRHDTDENARNNAQAYLNTSLKASTVTGEFIRLAYSSVSRIVIIPAQDILGLDETARLNNPANSHGNWTWKLTTDDIKHDDSERLRKLVWVYGR